MLHENLAAGRWQKLSLAEQLGNIGSEVGRARKTHGRDEKLFRGAFTRALELSDLTLADPRWRTPGRNPGGHLQEIARAREVFCDAALGGKEYGASLKDVENYFMPFAFAARQNF